MIPYLVGTVAAGAICLVGVGVLLLVKAVQVRRHITQSLLDEHATTPSSSGDSEEVFIPAELIYDARTAQLRVNEIKSHTLNEVGPYQQIPVESSARQWFLNGLTIRTALNMAVMGFGVIQLVMAVAALFMVVGIMVFGLTLAIALSD